MKKIKDWQKSDIEKFEDFFAVNDIVGKDVIEYFANSMIPVTDWSTLFQAGSPVDNIDGKNTYITFSNMDGNWRYKGNCHKGEKENPFSKWLDVFLKEKGINLLEEFSINNNDFKTTISYRNIVEEIKSTTEKEQNEIKNEIIKLDLNNVKIEDYLKYLAESLLPTKDEMKEMLETYGENIYGLEEINQRCELIPNYENLFQLMDKIDVSEKDKELVELCKNSYKENNLQLAYKYWCEIYELHSVKNFNSEEEKTKSMIQLYKTLELFSDEEVYKITDYGKKQVYKEMDYIEVDKQDTEESEEDEI